LVVSAVFEARCTLAFHVFLRHQQPCSAPLPCGRGVVVVTGVARNGSVPLVPCGPGRVATAAAAGLRENGSVHGRANGVAGCWCTVIHIYVHGREGGCDG
jgi:hypothetical protein